MKDAPTLYLYTPLDDKNLNILQQDWPDGSRSKSFRAGDDLNSLEDIGYFDPTTGEFIYHESDPVVPDPVNPIDPSSGGESGGESGGSSGAGGDDPSSGGEEPDPEHPPEIKAVRGRKLAL